MPPNAKWNLQQMGDGFAERLKLVTSASLALFVSGSTAPSSDVGPWWTGSGWYYFNYDTGVYEPQVLQQQSLGYWIGVAAPSPADYQFWISTTAGGSPLALNVYYSGAWTDVYTAVLANYATIVAMNAAIAAAIATEVANRDAAIAAAIAAIPAANAYPVGAAPSIDQTVNVTGAPIKLNFASETFDPDSVYDTTTSRYTAPVNGIYEVSCELQVDNGTATASGMELSLDVRKNGVTVLPGGNGTSVASPPGSRWYPQFTALISLQATDFIEFLLTGNDGVLTGNVTVSTPSSISVHLVQAT
jgi:hypothetical protein